MAGVNINKYQWEALYQANPVILDLLSGKTATATTPRTPDATQSWHFGRPRWSRWPPGGRPETSSTLHLDDVYDATGFTCYIHNI